MSEQVRNLKILGAVGLALFAAVLVIAVMLYHGSELPPEDLRQYSSSPTGYAPPPQPQVIPPGTVPRRPPPALAPREWRAAGALGQHAYTVNCAMCHGSPGHDIGPVGDTYLPRPTDLARYVPAHPAARLYAVITDGIRSTPTPEAARYLPQEWHAFRAITSPAERWAIVAVLKARFRATSGAR
jgi:mono/diheme cytochrome c family protein